MYDDYPAPAERRRRHRDLDEDDLAQESAVGRRAALDVAVPEDEPPEIGEPALAYFREEGWIDHVVREVKSGKEATVYCCAGGPLAGADLVAAKLYRPRDRRSFRNDAVYQAGRVILDKRLGRAFTNRTKKGQEVHQTLWIDHEWRTLTRLHALGADVPTPLARTEMALLMSYRGDADTPAPRLQDVSIEPHDAPALFHRLMRNVELFLANDIVHGDLSAFNVLYWERRATIIDFPQAVDPRVNPHARDLFRRDVGNLCRYFGRLGVRANAELIASGLWRRFMRAEL